MKLLLPHRMVGYQTIVLTQSVKSELCRDCVRLIAGDHGALPQLLCSMPCVPPVYLLIQCLLWRALPKPVILEDVVSCGT